MKKAILLATLFSIILMPFGVIAADYSLNDLYRIALEKSRTIDIAEDDLYISKREKDMTKAVLMPTLSAFGTHTRYSEEKTRGSTVLQPEYRNEWGLRLDQSVSLSGREITAYKIAKQGITKSGFDLESVKALYLIDVASSYYDVLNAGRALEIAQVNVERLTKHRDAAQKRLAAGAVTKTTLLRAEAELAGSRAELIRAENGLRLARTILSELVEVEADFGLMDDGEAADNVEMIESCGLSDLDCLKGLALEARSELKALSIQKDINTKEVDYAKGSYWPSLSIEGVYSRQEDEPVSSSFALDERIYGGITLDFPFFEGGLRRAEVSAARARTRQTEAEMFNLEKAVRVEVEQNYLNVLTTSAVLIQLKAEVEYALDNFNAVTKQFRHGLADSVDVIDANTLLVTSERERANAEYLYQLATIRLQRSTGTLLRSIAAGQ
ncbi:MAG: TolC family protein [Nitrospira sp.]|nr:TolC family protein [Nitrospira sp.]